MIYEQNCTPVIPPKSNKCDFVYYSKRQYKKRNLVERCFNKLKQFRHVATRYDRHASAYLAFAKLAAVRLWLRFYESTTQFLKRGHRIFSCTEWSILLHIMIVGVAFPAKNLVQNTSQCLQFPGFPIFHNLSFTFFQRNPLVTPQNSKGML